MRDDEIRTYGRIYRVIEDAMENVGGEVKRPEMDTCYLKPQIGTTFLLKRAMKIGAITNSVNDMLAALYDQLDSEIVDAPLDHHQQAIFALAANQDITTISVKEAMEELGVSKARISQLLAEGVLTGFRVRGKWQILKRSVESRKLSVNNSNNNETVVN